MSIGAALLREARRRARLTQAQLAARAGVTQSVISAYESGHRQPALSTLVALIDAAGFELDVLLRPASSRLDGLTGPLGQRVRRNRHALTVAATAHGVTNLRVFGSVARGHDGPNSDVDLLVDLPPTMSLVGLGKIQDELESILGARVDLVPEGDLKPDVRVRVDEEAVPL